MSDRAQAPETQDPDKCICGRPIGHDGFCRPF